MAENSKLKITKVSLVASLVIGTFGGTAAASDLCGGALVIDAPTTLSKIARQCDVDLAALREANPAHGNEVRSGAYIALPSNESAQSSKAATQPSTPAPIKPAPASSTANASLGPVVSHYAARISTRNRINGVKPASTSVGEWGVVRASTNRLAPGDRLSFQQRAALRIHNAGIPIMPMPSDAFVGVTNVSATSEASGTPKPHYGLPAASALNKESAYSITNGAYRLPDFNAINPTAAGQAKIISVSGPIIGEANGCLFMQSQRGPAWALASTQDPESLLGKHVTAWGVMGESGVCGAAPTVIVSHTVHADRLN